MARESIGNGTIISVKVGDAYKELGDIKKTGDLGGEAEKVEVTTLKDEVKRYIKGLIDYDSISFEGNFCDDKDSSYRILKSIEDANSVNEFKITFGSGTSIVFTASVCTILKGIESGNIKEFEAKLYPNSKLDITLPA